MLLYRGALVYAEDRDGENPVVAAVLRYGHGGLPAAVHASITAAVTVNNGRWVVPCPWCFSASLASRTDHRFFCVECHNAGAQGKWIQVIWPALKDEIEALLIMRSDPRTRNWAPPETVADLLAENESHGVL